MRLLKPLWLAHVEEGRQCEIYSISASSDGKRLASGGQDSKVRIWSVDAVLKTPAEGEDATPQLPQAPPDGPRQLCSMSNHGGAVTVVRFCPRGQYLASGSDDKVVLIWELDKSRVPRQEFGSVGEKDSEVWTARKRLIGHESDVQDLAWSPNGSLLVTVGLDSTVIVWSGTTFEMLKKIDIHESHIKGVAFDPANKYFITCSDDRTAQIVRYIRTSPTEFTFSVEKTITAPFVNSPLNTFFRRCSWAPNGETIACPNAVNGPVPTVGIINRGDWDADTSLCGHEGPCEVACFNPCVFAPDKLSANSKDAVSNNTCVIATGGQDSSLAIWNTTNPRPLTVVRNVARRPISDITWLPDGLHVFASSLDGSVFMLEFAPGDLGWPVSREVVLEHLKRYGTSSQDMSLLEGVEQLDMETKYHTPEPTALGEPEAPTPSPAPVSTPAPTIVPPPAPVKPTTPEPTTLPLDPKSASTKDSRLKEAKAEVPQNQNKSSTARSTMKQKVTFTKDGKKRIAPILIQEDEPVSANNVVTASKAPINVGSGSGYTQTTSRSANTEFTRPSNSLPVGGINTLLVGNKRKPHDGEMPSNKKSRDAPQQFIRPAVLNPATTVSQTRLATQKVYTHISLDRAASAVIEIRNGEQPTDPARVTVLQNGANLFIDYIAGKAHMLTGDVDFFWAVTTENGTLHVYSPSGSHVFPAIILGTAAAVLESAEKYLLCITNVGLLQVWDIIERKSLFPPVSIAPILDSGSKYGDNGVLKAPTITQCILGNTGRFVITLSNGTAHTYSPEMMAWHRISEPSWAYSSQFWDSTGFASLFDSGQRASGPVSMAERRTNEECLLKAGARGKQLQRIARNRILQDGYQGYEDVVSMAHLQNRMLGALMLDSQSELVKFMEMYVRQAAKHSMADKLNELFIFLLHDGVDVALARNSSHELLRKMLKVASEHRGALNIVMQYDEALNNLEQDIEMP